MWPAPLATTEPVNRIITDRGGAVMKKRHRSWSDGAGFARPVEVRADPFMASARCRSRRSLSQRSLQQDLQGARDALIAFDGFEPAGHPVPAAVLQRPSTGSTLRGWPQWLERAGQWWASMRQR